MTIGLDSNILCYSLDVDYPEHKYVKSLLISLSSNNILALNPTVLHETYHVLVFCAEWLPQEAARRLLTLLKHPYIQFFGQTRKITQIALNIAAKHDLGGRDALILANFLANKVPVVLTHDVDLLKLKRVTWKNSNIVFQDPLAKSK